MVKLFSKNLWGIGGSAPKVFFSVSKRRKIGKQSSGLFPVRSPLPRRSVAGRVPPARSDPSPGVSYLGRRPRETDLQVVPVPPPKARAVLWRQRQRWGTVSATHPLPPPALIPRRYMYPLWRGRGRKLYSLIPKGAAPPLGTPSICDSLSISQKASKSGGLSKGGVSPPLEIIELYPPPMPVGYLPTHRKGMGGGRGWVEPNQRALGFANLSRVRGEKGELQIPSGGRLRHNRLWFSTGLSPRGEKRPDWRGKPRKKPVDRQGVPRV